MKILTIVIPCYNSQNYMRHAIESLLPGGDKVEIIIVNDGSADDTAEIAKEYVKRYPDIVKAIHQENGGHGEAVNTGIKYAAGLYLKVVDSDDWVERNAYIKIIEVLEQLTIKESAVDMLISNFVYEKEGMNYKKVMHYRGVFPQKRILHWDEVGHIPKGKYILMHSVIFRTELLRKSGLKLPKHTFYVDNLFVYLPLPYVSTIYYIDLDFYRYYIGREDQSVNEKIMISRIDQQIKVNKLMLEQVDLYKIENKKIKQYMFHYLEIITMISSILLIRSGTKENLIKKKMLWKDMKRVNRRLYYRLRIGIMGLTLNLPGRGGRRISVATYKLLQKLVGFN